ncbi:Rho guanine nucleotide exchange factor 6, partial [Halocaridina rubra]
ANCGSIRRQKELELEVITGRVHGWDGGETLGTLGDVIRMGSVALLPDHRDRYLVLFPTTLVMLAVSPRMSAFIFE